MGWDSNPRGACAPAGFQDRCLKPLGHPSVSDDLALPIGLPIGLNVPGIVPETGPARYAASILTAASSCIGAVTCVLRTLGCKSAGEIKYYSRKAPVARSGLLRAATPKIAHLCVTGHTNICPAGSMAAVLTRACALYQEGSVAAPPVPSLRNHRCDGRAAKRGPSYPRGSHPLPLVSCNQGVSRRRVLELRWHRRGSLRCLRRLGADRSRTATLMPAYQCCFLNDKGHTVRIEAFHASDTAEAHREAMSRMRGAFAGFELWSESRRAAEYKVAKLASPGSPGC